MSNEILFVLLDSFEENTVERTDPMLLQLSECISEPEELRVLVILGLNIKEHILRRHLANNRHDITSAAFGLLKDWRRTQTNARVAYNNLREALLKANMSYYITLALV